MARLFFIFSFLTLYFSVAASDTIVSDKGRSEMLLFAQVFFHPGVARTEVRKYLGLATFSDANGTDWYLLTDEECEKLNRKGKEIYVRIHYKSSKVTKTENVEINLFRKFPNDR